MASTANTIKTRIQTILNGLVASGTPTSAQLGAVIMDDFKKSIFGRDIPAYPVAILTTPSIDSKAETNVQNTRTYAFEILVLLRAEDVDDPAQVEDLIEAILNQFDNDPTLKAGESTGISDAGVEPSTSAPEAITNGDTSYIAFTIALRAKAVRDLTFT